MAWFLPYIGIPAAVLTAVALWNTFDLPRLAWASELQKLNRNQAQQAVELYNTKLRSLLSIPAPASEPNKSIWQEEVDQAKREQRAAERRWLELK